VAKISLESIRTSFLPKSMSILLLFFAILTILNYLRLDGFLHMSAPIYADLQTPAKT
jgi:hypothetical protein